jgi:predicted DNA-binding transcriptional regulator AlpA
MYIHRVALSNRGGPRQFSAQLMQVAPQYGATFVMKIRRPRKILRTKTTADKCGVVPITITRWATDPKYAHMNFPKPISMGENSKGFFEDEVDDWLEARAAEREAV